MSTVSTEATSAPAQLPGIREVSKVAAGTYKLEPDHTQVLFTFNHLGFTDYTGQFVQPSGSLTIEPAHPNNSKVDVTFAIAQVSTTSLTSTRFYRRQSFSMLPNFLKPVSHRRRWWRTIPMPRSMAT
jgi:polyisoprenoid-binding protein YceI